MAMQGAGNAAPALEGDVFVTRDGLKLPVRHWDAPQPIAVIVALHGMSDYSNAFDMPGTWWAAHGITTLAYDQRGFGRSRRIRAYGLALDALRGDPRRFRRRGACEISGTCRCMRWARAWAAQWC